MKQASEMTNAELLAYFNDNCQKIGRDQVKKFASRDAAIQRVTALMEAITPEAEKTGRAVSIALSWTRHDVKVARSLRYQVSVDGAQYKSVAAALTALGLPLTKTVKIRGLLVKGDIVEFEGRTFKLVG
jgi:hypothetical protein